MMKPSKVTIERSFSQADFDRFARLSGDDNPIHVDPEFSARTRFGRTVAHGLLLCSVLRGLIHQLFPEGRVEEQTLMFPAPTYTDELMRFSAEVYEASGARALLRFEVKRIADDMITCQGDCRVAK